MFVRRLIDRGRRYTLIGTVCALLNYAIMLANDAVGWHYLLGTVFSLLAVTPIAYVLHSLFTFRERLGVKALVRFVSGIASAYPIATAVMILLCSGLHLSIAIATPIATVIMFVWNFAAAHWSILPEGSLSKAQFDH